jgi:simple sugar transport system ATP-binding protein
MKERSEVLREEPAGREGMSEPVLIEVRELDKSFGAVHALDRVSLDIRAGEVHALIGENGSGKSTLIKIIAGALAPDRGEIRISGKSFNRLAPIDAIRHGIQVIFQDFSLFPNLSVAENVALNSELSKGSILVDWREVRKVAVNAVRELSVDLELDALVEDLPVADRQLTAICRALLQDARLIIMDEPTTALSRREVDALYSVVERLTSRGVAILFVSHRLDEVCRIADRISVLRNGQKVGEATAGGFDQATLARLMTGRRLDRSGRGGSSENTSVGPALLTVAGLGRAGRYRDISFEMRTGEILGLTGRLGSGQTALALGLFGLLPYHLGRVSVDGKGVRIRNVGDALRLGIGYVPEDRLTEGLFPGHSVGVNLGVTLLERLANFLGWSDREALGRQTLRWAEAVGIPAAVTGRPVRSLSGGNQQRVVLARWLAVSPRILLLNNPTAGVDVGSKYDLHRMIREEARRGTGVLLISDDLPELLDNCDRILMMRNGRIVEELQGRLDEHQLYEHVTGDP